MFYVYPKLGKISILTTVMFFKWVETTNQFALEMNVGLFSKNHINWNAYVFRNFTFGTPQKWMSFLIAYFCKVPIYLDVFFVCWIF